MDDFQRLEVSPANGDVLVEEVGVGVTRCRHRHVKQVVHRQNLGGEERE